VSKQKNLNNSSPLLFDALDYGAQHEKSQTCKVQADYIRVPYTDICLRCNKTLRATARHGIQVNKTGLLLRKCFLSVAHKTRGTRMPNVFPFPDFLQWYGATVIGPRVYSGQRGVNLSSEP
jgi:hypothetical protein